MNRTFALCVLAWAFSIAGCSGSSLIAPLQTPGGIAQSVTEENSTRGALLYVSAEQRKVVYVYTFPEGELVQTLKDFGLPTGICVDKAGNVWIVDARESKLLEYAHGGTKPIATLAENPHKDLPQVCSVDPKSGDLAVLNARVGIAIFHKARGKPTRYDRKGLSHLGYDDKGDLFEDGTSYSNHKPIFAVLRPGAGKFSTIKLDQHIAYLGDIHWDGSYLAVSDLEFTEIHRFAIVGSHGITKGTVQLRKAISIDRFWVQGQYVAAATGRTYVKLWNYPEGGKPVKALYHVVYPFDVAVSPGR